VRRSSASKERKTQDGEEDLRVHDYFQGASVANVTTSAMFENTALLLLSFILRMWEQNNTN
jgi:hypothetical protein